MGEREHGAKGLCQERAFVSGIEAANLLARSGVLDAAANANDSSQQSRRHNVNQNLQYGRQANVIPVRSDELQFQLAKTANSKAMSFLSKIGLDSSQFLR
jgi:HAMP domain-containing protein